MSSPGGSSIARRRELERVRRRPIEVAPRRSGRWLLCPAHGNVSALLGCSCWRYRR